jgi:hypothetical protein
VVFHGRVHGALEADWRVMHDIARAPATGSRVRDAPTGHNTCVPYSSISILDANCSLNTTVFLWQLQLRIIMSNSSPLPSYSSPAQFAAGRRDVPSTPGALAFLVHSQETVANKMPPDVDNKALARQRRRRTRYVTFCHFSSIRASISTMLIRLLATRSLSIAKSARARLDSASTTPPSTPH